MRLRARGENLLVEDGDKKVWVSGKMLGTNAPVTPEQTHEMVTHAYVTRTFSSDQRVMATVSFVLLDGGSVSTAFPSRWRENQAGRKKR